MAGHAQRRLQDASSLWVLEAYFVMQQSADKVRLLMVQTFIYSAVMYGAKCGDTTKAVKTRCQQS
jgi:hypothetical protein